MAVTMADILADHLAAAARALMLAGRWAQATDLLAAAAPTDEAERSVLAVTAAEVAVDQDFWIRTSGGSRALDHASAIVASRELEFIRLKHDYNAELFRSWQPDAAPPDPAVIAELGTRAARLRDIAPSADERAWAAFYVGLIADVLRGDPSASREAYTQARTDAAVAGDNLALSYALRHLGYLDAQEGSAEAAREQLTQSLELRQRAGCVPHVLAQLLALAELSDDKSWVQAVAGVAQQWALGLDGSPWLTDAAAELLDS
jgi:hypothetical protein